jgi:xylan 1,4-beta-xylosidase
MKTKLLSFWLLFAVCLTHAQKPIYSNPVLRGDFPDPSVIRVGEDYWATATASEWGPLYPMLHSRDLINWELKGHIFTKKPEWSSQNYWAPELDYYKGKFYVYYVGRKNEKNGRLHVAVATAENALGPWTDHGPLIGQDDGSIDGIIETDEKGERYMLWKNDGNSRGEPTFIYAQKLSEDGLKLIGEMKQLIRNDQPWEGSLIEGPDVIKHGEYFYIFYAGNGCCGKKCSYGTGVARSKSLLGPYEKNPNNPIITHNDKWRCPGHGTLVSTPDGRDYYLLHAYSSNGTVYVGRQGVLEPITWKEDGWPQINEGRGISSQAASPFGKTQKPLLGFEDDFTDEKLGFQWQWPHMIDPQYRIEKGVLALQSTGERGNELFGSVLAVQTTVGNYAATTFINTKDLAVGTKAGLSAFGDLHNALAILIGDGKVGIVRRQKNKTEEVASVPAPALNKTYLRMTATDGHKFQFAFWDGKVWKQVGDVAVLEGDYLPPWDRGVRVALTSGGAPAASAKFDWLRIVLTDAPVN